jgi:peroxiredoxin
MSTRLWWATLALATLAPMPGALAQSPLEAVISSLKQAEHGRGPRRMVLEITERESKAREGETLDETRTRLRSERGGFTAAGRLIASDSGWRKEWSHVDGPGVPSARTVIVFYAQTHRTLIELAGDGQTQRQGILATQAAVAPGDALLAGHFAEYLADFRFGERTERGESIEISLQRGEELLTLVAPRGRESRFERLRLDRPIPGQPVTVRQNYEALVEYTGDEIRRVEEVITTPAPFRVTAYRAMVVNSREGTADESEIAGFRFPVGTIVRDQRFASPVEYEQGEQDPPEAEIRKLAQPSTQPPATVGDRARDFTLRDDRGETVRLSELRGKIVILYWYAPWSEACAQHAAEMEREFHRRLRARGVQVWGIQVAAEGDAVAMARAYRSRFALTFPLLLDGTAATLRLLGPGQGVPQIVVVDRQGTIRYSDTGWNRDALSQLVDVVLDEDTPAKVKAPMLRSRGPQKRGR